MMYPKFKVGDLVRSKWGYKGKNGLGIVCSEDPTESDFGAYYRIFYFEDNEEIWGHPRDWDLVE